MRENTYTEYISHIVGNYMKIDFRQGIVRTSTSISAPSFLQKTSLSGNSVDLVISPEPTIIAFAHYGQNYLFEETRSIVGAWGSDVAGSINGPLAAGQTHYLFWDVNLATGELTRGWTLVSPVVSTTEPSNPEVDTHWFDLTNTVMKVFKKPNPSNPGYWQDKVRLFAGVFHASANVVANSIGSQVGITGGDYSAGNIILGSNNKPLRQSDGTFVTTESDLIIYQTSGQNVKFDMALVYAQASEEIPKFHLVTFKPDRKIGLATSTSYTEFVSGIVVEDLYQDEVGQIITNGVVRNEQWAWPADKINKPLFCGQTGQVTLQPPVVGTVQQVGFVYDATSIYMNLFPPIRLR